MAAQLKLVRRADLAVPSADISSLSLFNYEDGFSLTRDGWIPGVARDGDDRTAEAMTLRAEASSHDDMASTLQLMDDKLREVDGYATDIERYGVWLRAQLPDETNARQVLITQAAGEIGSPAFAPPLSPGNALREYRLALERTPYWETLYSYIYSASTVNCRGGMGSYGTVSGNCPARIARTSFLGASGGGTGDLYEFWMGFRTDRYGDQTNLVPLWDLGQSGDSTPYNDTTSTYDADAQGNYKWVCSFGTATELRRLQAALMSFTSNYNDQRGEYTVLLRAKVGASTVCHVRLKDGFVNTSELRSQPRVKIDSTDWLLYPLGTVTIPPSRGVLDTGWLGQYGFELWASRASGSNDLHMDCIILIPRSEGFIHVSGGAVKYWLGDQRPIEVRMYPEGGGAGWWYQQHQITGVTMPHTSVKIEPENYTLPIGAGSLVLAGQRETSHVLTDYIDVRLYGYKHYRTLRGSG